jgi:hypothetical protein
MVKPVCLRKNGKTIDDGTGKAKLNCWNLTTIRYDFYGKVIDIIDVDKKKVFVLLVLRRKNKPIMGLHIIKAYAHNSGKIFDPVTGKQYKCFYCSWRKWQIECIILSFVIWTQTWIALSKYSKWAWVYHIAKFITLNFKIDVFCWSNLTASL